MNRKEFRVWDKDLKKMFYSAFSITSYGDVIDAGWREEVGVTEHGYYDHNMRGGVDCIVMQSTGLEDRDGEMIWEGDIVKNPDARQLTVVGWDNDGAKFDMVETDKAGYKFGYTFGFLENFDLEIIGNIYENPDIVV